MEKARLSTLVLFLCLIFIFSSSHMLSGCRPNENAIHVIIQEWVSIEFGGLAIVDISGELEANLSGFSIFRGGITHDGSRKEGIFFYNLTNGDVHFKKGLFLPSNNKEGANA